MDSSLRPRLLFCFVALALCSAHLVQARTVDTFLSGTVAFDGMTFDEGGNLYATQYTSPPQTGNLYKITPDGTVTILRAGLRGAAGVAIDGAGFIFVAEYNSSTVRKISPTGQAEIFASGFNGPIGLDFDSLGNLYVQNFNVSTVQRVNPSGVVELFATVPGYTVGSALAIDDEDNLYLTSYSSNRIYRVTPDGTPSFYLAGGSPGYGFIRWGSGQLYLTGINDHRIYSLTPSAGAVLNVIAGTGVPGTTDGPADQAEFDTPLGLAVLPTPGGDILYVGEPPSVSFRRITPEATSSTEEVVLHGERSALAFPNPFRQSTTLRFRTPTTGRVQVDLFDVSGKQVRGLSIMTQHPGSQSVVWDGKDEAGRDVESGVYAFRFSSDGSIGSGQVIKLP